MHNETDDSLDEIIFDGIRFMQSIARHYGAERSIELWNKMGEAFGDEVKGKIFFAMLTNESPNHVRVSRGYCTEPVAAIKAIRTATGLGLKESKDLWDLAATKIVIIDGVYPEQRVAFVREIRRLGMKIH